MRKNKTIPTQGQFSDVIGVVGENFNRQYMNLLELQFNMQKFCGMFKTLDILNSTVTSPQEGMYAYVLDFTYNAATWDQSANGTYDANKLYSNIYTYTNGAWAVSGVYDGSVTVYDGSSTEQSSAAAAVLTQTGNVNGFKWNGSLVTDITVGSIGKGQTFPVGTMLEYIIRKMFYVAPVYYAGYIEITVNKTECEYGTAGSEITVTITIVKRDSGAASNIKLFRNGVEIPDYDGSSMTYTETIANVTETLTYTASCDFAAGASGTGIAAQTGKTTATPATVTPRWYWYAGKISQSKIPNEEEIKALQYKEFYRGSKGGMSLGGANARAVVVAVPDGAGKPELIDPISSKNIFNDTDTSYNHLNEIIIKGANNVGSNKYKVYTYFYDDGDSTTYATFNIN